MSIITDLRKTVLNHMGANKVSVSSIQAEREPVVDNTLTLPPQPAKPRSRRTMQTSNAIDQTAANEIHVSEALGEPYCSPSTRVGEILGEADNLANSSSTVSPPLSSGKTTKTALCLHMLSTEVGASIADIMTATRWQSHSVRGFLSATVRKKLGLHLINIENENGVRRYKIVAPSTIGQVN